ncbi:hypothetical protein D3C71_1781590 [compost metagenome]
MDALLQSATLDFIDHPLRHSAVTDDQPTNAPVFLERFRCGEDCREILSIADVSSEHYVEALRLDLYLRRSNRLLYIEQHLGPTGEVFDSGAIARVLLDLRHKAFRLRQDQVAALVDERHKPSH